MRTKQIPFRGYNVDVWVFNGRTFYYPDFNGNAEYTSFRECCSYIRRAIWVNKQLKEFWWRACSINISL